MAIAAAGAEVGIFCRQGGRLDPVDGVGVGVLRGDGSTALALADKRAEEEGAPAPIAADSEASADTPADAEAPAAAES